MANEINIQAVLTLQRTGLSLQGSGSKDVDQASGSNGITNIQTVAASTSTGTAISFGGISFPSARGFLFVKNTDLTNYVDLSLANTDQTAFDGSLFARVRAGELCLLPIKTDKSYYARANTSAVTIQVAVVAS